MEKANRILVDQGLRTELHRDGYGSRPFIAKAINGFSETPKAIRVREEAIRRGGIEVKPVNTPNHEKCN